MNKLRKALSGIPLATAVRILNVLIAVFAVIALIAGIRMVNELRDTYDRDRYVTIDYDLREGNYAGMIRECYRRAYDVDPYRSAYEEDFSLALYADAAFRNSFFEAVGDTENAQRMRERMETEKERSGSLSAATEDIDRAIARIPLYLD